jgi:hypothetical protein
MSNDFKLFKTKQKKIFELFFSLSLSISDFLYKLVIIWLKIRLINLLINDLKKKIAYLLRECFFSKVLELLIVG